jgi:single-stranded-DNA-specific exonuclease
LQESWVIAARASESSARLADELALPEPLARLLICRGYPTAEAAQAFLHPSLNQLHDPYSMLGMSTAVDRILVALRAGEPILIYGDYDVDGTVATVLLKTALERAAAALGLTADVRYHIPHRIREGYGMQDARIESAAAEGVRLVISVDTGIRAFAAAAEAQRVGLDLIVTDHHLPDGQGVPNAVAVLNPNQPGCTYPYKDLCGAGVAFKLAQALLETAALDESARQRLREKTLPSFLKLLAIATIADAVPLTGENRAIAAIGLAELRKPAQPGLRALMDLAAIDYGPNNTRAISASDIGFRLAPRINAAGRMDVASDVVDLFLSRDPAQAKTLAAKLHRLNDDRRASESDALRFIDAHIDTLPELPACFILDDLDLSPAWHRGVIGILASRVVDRTGRPALVITHEDGQAYGSGRSVRGLHLLDALTAAHSQSPAHLLSRFGGHAHAVGFSLPSALVPTLRERMLLIASEHQGDQPIAEELACDVDVPLSAITPAFLAALERLGPFGMGNAEPVFVSTGLRIAQPLKVIKDKHLKLCVEAGGTRFNAMAWSRRTNWVEVAASEGWGQDSRIDLAYRMRHNTHPDFGGWELEIVGMRSSTAPGHA